MNKCNIQNVKITLCSELELLISKDTKFEKVTYAFMGNLSEEFIGEITYRYGRKKHDLVALSFCPICGGGLRDDSSIK